MITQITIVEVHVPVRFPFNLSPQHYNKGIHILTFIQYFFGTIQFTI
jgi:hypothetical protein